MSVSIPILRILFRWFGLVIGVVSTAYFALAFWLMIQGIDVRLIETNRLVVTIELSMAMAGFIVLFAILLSEITNCRSSNQS